jgi:hypothetical protein
VSLQPKICMAGMSPLRAALGNAYDSAQTYEVVD